MTVDLIQALLLAFALVVILMPSYIRLLRAIGMGKRIRVEGPETHQAKYGTPTMGGLLIIAVVVVLFYLLRGFPQRAIIAPLVTLLLVGVLGAVDDFLNARTGEGIRARAEELKKRGDYVLSHTLQALAIESADAYAEKLHRDLRTGWGFPDPPGSR